MKAFQEYVLTSGLELRVHANGSVHFKWKDRVDTWRVLFESSQDVKDAMPALELACSAEKKAGDAYVASLEDSLRIAKEHIKNQKEYIEELKATVSNLSSCTARG